MTVCTAGDIESQPFRRQMSRFMFLFGHCSLARGNEVRSSTLSDLFKYKMPYNMGPHREDVMCILSTDAKTNKHGQVG